MAAVRCFFDFDAIIGEEKIVIYKGTKTGIEYREN